MVAEGDGNMYVWSINNVYNYKCICWFFLKKRLFTYMLLIIIYLLKYCSVLGIILSFIYVHVEI
jgi:hypothetical protein